MPVLGHATLPVVVLKSKLVQHWLVLTKSDATGQVRSTFDPCILVSPEICSMDCHSDRLHCLHSVVMLGQGATTKSSFVRREHVSVQCEATDVLSSQHLLEIAALPSSVFIVFHRGCPLVVSGLADSSGSRRSGTVNLIRLHHSAVESFLTKDNLIFLGRTKSPSDVETLLMDAENCNILPENDSHLSVAYFCVDLSKLSTDEVTHLCSEGMNVELSHPYSFVQMPSEDRKLFSRASPLLDWHRKNQFCPACGSATSMAQGGYKRVCKNADCLTHKGWNFRHIFCYYVFIVNNFIFSYYLLVITSVSVKTSTV